MNCAELLFLCVSAPSPASRPLAGLTRPALSTLPCGTHLVLRNASADITVHQIPEITSLMQVLRFEHTDSS